MPNRVHSVVVDVADLEAATRDYERMLGASPARHEHDPARGTRSVFFVLENVALELQTGASPGTEADGERVEEGAATGQSGLRLASDPAEIEALRGAGRLELGPASRQVGRGEGGAPDRHWTRHVLPPSASRGLPVELVSEESPPLEASPSAGPDDDPAARVTRLDHLVVFSPAPDATAAFYGDGLGVRLALDRTFEARGVRLLFFRLGGTTIEIGARLGGPASAARPDRFGGLAWQVPDVDAIRRRLAADGFDVSETRAGHKPGTRVCTVRDPVHGVPTLLIQPAAARSDGSPVPGAAPAGSVS